MLVSKPRNSNVHPGGGISVRINGASVEANKASQVSRSTLTERCSGNTEDDVLNRSTAEASLETAPPKCTATGFVEATISWRNGAKRCSGNTGGTCCDNSAPVPPTNSTPHTAPGLPSHAELVRIIPVRTSMPLESDLGAMERCKAITNQSDPKAIITLSTIKISSTAPSPTNLISGSTNSEYCGDRVSVVVDSGVNKADDERSSSGASSEPCSDCERSDSEREADDGVDSGFSLSRPECPRVVLRSKNASRHLSVSSNVTANSTNHAIIETLAGRAENGRVRLSLTPYSETQNQKSSSSEVLFMDVQPNGHWNTHFYMHELDTVETERKKDAEDVQAKISKAHALLTGDSGTFSLKNRVRTSIVSLLVQSSCNRNYDQEETGRVVFYTTSMGIIRNTYERCRKVRKILETLMVKFEERDVFMNRGFQQEIKERLALRRVDVPQVFVEGRHLGNAEVIEQLNEIGCLRELLRPYKKHSVGNVCKQCGGYRYLLCPVCGGSKKSMTHRHHFSEDLVSLRCVTCDESGLIRCPECVNGEG